MRRVVGPGTALVLCAALTAGVAPAHASGTAGDVRELGNAELVQVLGSLLPMVASSASAGVVVSRPDANYEGQVTPQPPVHISGDRTVVSHGVSEHRDGAWRISEAHEVHTGGVTWRPRELLVPEDVRRARAWLGVEVPGVVERVLPDEGAELTRQLHPAVLLAAQHDRALREPGDVGRMSFVPPHGGSPGTLLLAVDADAGTGGRATEYRLTVTGPEGAGIRDLTGARVDSVGDAIPRGAVFAAEPWAGSYTYAYGPNRAVPVDATRYLPGRLYGRTIMTGAMNADLGQELRGIRSAVQEVAARKGRRAARRAFHREVRDFVWLWNN